MKNAPSYHDLYITAADLPRSRLADLPFNVHVICTRVGGWEVWHKPDRAGEPQLLAGEYSAAGLVLDVAGYVIVDSLNAGRVEAG